VQLYTPTTSFLRLVFAGVSQHQFKARLWSRSPSNFWWLQPEPKIFW